MTEKEQALIDKYGRAAQVNEVRPDVAELIAQLKAGNLSAVNQEQKKLLQAAGIDTSNLPTVPTQAAEIGIRLESEGEDYSGK